MWHWCWPPPPLIYNNVYVCMDPCSLVENHSPCSTSHQPSCTTCSGGRSKRAKLPNNPRREWDALATSISVPIAARGNGGLPFIPGILPWLLSLLSAGLDHTTTDLEVMVARVLWFIVGIMNTAQTRH